MIEVVKEGWFVVADGGDRALFRVVFRDRRDLRINVLPDQRVEVLAPASARLGDVLGRVDKRSAWIFKKIQYFERFQPKTPERQYVSGETVLYLGRQYRLKVLERAAESVKLIGRFLTVCALDREDLVRTKQLVEQWYHQRASQLFEQRLAVHAKDCRSLNLLEVPKLTVRRMLRRWGSCTKAGRLLLNVELVQVPIHCVDYVIVHELCHLRVHNHSPAFYRLLTRVMPDWQQRKRRLDEIALP